MSHNKSYTDTYVAEVTSVEDSEKKCRVKVNVYDVFDGVPVSDLPWATFNLPLGSRPGEGLVTPVQVGDVVRVQFDHGDTRYPIIIGSAQAMPDGVTNLPPEGMQGAGGFEHKRTANQPPVAEAPYYEDVVYKQNNCLVQLCRAGNIRITQLNSGSAVELLPDGDVVIHCEKDLYISSEGNVLQEVEGDYKLQIKGNFTQEVQGDMQHLSTGDAVYGSGGAGLTLTSETQSHFIGGGGFVSDGPARYNNGISAKSIKSDTTIVAPSITEGATTSDPDY